MEAAEAEAREGKESEGGDSSPVPIPTKGSSVLKRNHSTAISVLIILTASISRMSKKNHI